MLFEAEQPLRSLSVGLCVVWRKMESIPDIFSLSTPEWESRNLGRIGGAKLQENENPYFGDMVLLS